MARSDIHPSLCFYHADREEQLFGDPSSRFETRKLDFPELFSASRDLSTAAGVNRALAQVFRLLAQRRISRQEAATFGHLAKLLLRTISLMNADSERDAEASVVIPSSGESLFAANVYQQDELRGVDKVDQELSPVNKVNHERGIPPEVLPYDKLSARPDDVSKPVTLSESALADESKDLSVARPHSTRSRAPSEVVIPKTSSPISAPTFADRAESGRCGEDEESRPERRTAAPHEQAFRGRFARRDHKFSKNEHIRCFRP